MLGAPHAAQAQAKEKITYAYQLDPMFEAAMWALKNGKVTSDKIAVELTVLPIPALIQATPTKQFDVIQSDTIAVPRSAERGLQLTIMSTAIRYRPGRAGAPHLRRQGFEGADAAGSEGRQRSACRRSARPDFICCALRLPKNTR